jgi:dynein heavy chain
MMTPFVYESVKTPFFKLMVPTIDTMRYTDLMYTLSQNKKPIYFTGGTGTGKSMIVQQYVQSRRDECHLNPIMLNFSAQTSAQETQKMIEEKLEKKRAKLYGASGKATCFIFIDDINMPRKEEYGAQPPIELLRHLVDRGGFYARPEDGFFWKRIEKFTVVAAAAPPGGGRTTLTPRFMRHFHIFNI